MTRIALLSGGVGGARLARGLAAVPEVDLTVVVNVGDDAEIYGLHVSADVDTVVYTLGGVEGPQGWGVAEDTFTVMDHLAALGTDTTFRIGDADLALNVYRSAALRSGERLSEVTRRLAARLGVTSTILPASDDPVRTEVRTAAGDWLQFQEYFVIRGHRDDVTGVRFAGAADAVAAAGVIESIAAADAVVVGPSNPPLSIWPILAVAGIREAVAEAPLVIGVSPLIGGRALKGPADRVMAGLGLEAGTAGVIEAYRGLLSDLVVDTSDAAGVAHPEVRIHAADTRIAEPAAAARLARFLLEVP